MQKRTLRITNETALYLLAFGVALGLRLVRLGDGPLSDFEAGWALQSWQAVTGQVYQVGPNPGYFSLTALVFYLLGDGNGLARLWPALAGSLVVLVPLGFRRWLGAGASLVLAFGLAMDAGMVVVSRLAGGPMMALGFGLFAALFYVTRKPVWAGVLAGLALISGPGVVTAVLGLLVAYGLGRLAGLGLKLPAAPGMDTVDERPAWSRQDSLTAALVAVSSAVLAGTMFLRYPSGLGGWGSILGAYWTGWSHPSGIPFGRLLAALAAYQPLALVYAVIAGVRGWHQGDRVLQWLSLWFVAALLVVGVYPGRQVYDAVWCLLPLWALAATEIRRYFIRPAYPLAAASQAGIVTVLLAILWIVSLNIVPEGMSWLVLAALPLLIVATTILVGLGWAWQSSLHGVAWGLIVSLGLYGLSAMMGASQVRPNAAAELWQPLPGVGQVDLLIESLEELGLIQHGRQDWIDIVSSVTSPALAWALRDFTEVHQVSVVAAEVLTSVIFTPLGSEDESLESAPALSQVMAYRGQDFTWASYPAWQGALPPSWWRWITSREAPLQADKIILWARSDLFPQDLQADPIDPAAAPEEGLDGEPQSEPQE